MTTTYFIAGAVFLALSIIWSIMKWAKKRNDKKKKRDKDIDDAIDRGDWNDLDDARMRQ